ncbi:probable xyloglucan galactosyltransferase GT14 [Punica granatum]|uniref:Exostosin GT47 domain-containing protein n=2 Tax=Punica granatum TaxID=22663 RepID=A0A218WEP0_PUNGR|nr:probable xyloglucan galactosyltransferase GT14 [Punica granatum]OWM70959.1 hypothetical protein CDL15_Pgr013140 [Punica granatum]PKI47005.1 hypothetical protein CRG98_032630 [Punica granatum]
MEKKPNLIKKANGQSMSTFIFFFLICFIVLLLHFFDFGGAKSGVSSLFISYYHSQDDVPARSCVLNVTDESSNVDPCSGRYIYVHNLPQRFNDDLLKNCRAIAKWNDVCWFVSNSGLGPKVEDPRGILSNGSWYSTYQFFLEPIFRARMKQYRCLTNDSSLASAIYVPFYAGLDVGRHLWGYNVSVRDALAHELAQWVSARPEWKRMWGRDHFVVGGRISWDYRRNIDNDSEWGNNFMNLPESKNMTLLSIESTLWTNEFAIPYPTYFHPSTILEVSQWQERMRNQNRKYLFSFVGAPRPKSKESIRSNLVEQCSQASNSSSTDTCFLLACRSGKNNKCNDPCEIIRVFQNSVFCLQPPGDSHTRRSTFDSILAGCIPVFFHPGSAYVQYLWYFPSNYTKYSVYIPEEDVRSRRVNIGHRLMSISSIEVEAMREEVIGMIPRIVYANPRNDGLPEFEDAFDVAIKGVLGRIEAIRRRISQGEDPSVGFSDWDSRKFDLPSVV